MRRKNVEDLYPLSPLQEGLLFHSLYAGRSSLYVTQYAWTWERVDPEILNAAWQRVIDGTPVLRTAFVWEGLDTPLQIVVRRLAVPLAHHDWRSLAAAERDARWRAFLEADRARGFDLARAPLMRLALVDFGDHAEDGRYRMVWTHHHVLLDGWSVRLVLRALREAYRALAAGDGDGPPRSPPYRGYIAWLGRQDRVAAERFWRRMLRGLRSPTTLAADREQDAEAPPAVKDQRAADVRLPAARTAALSRLAGEQRLTLATLVQAAWASLLARHTGRDDVVFGVTVAGRPADLHGAEAMYGRIINTLPVRLRLPASSRLLAWLQTVQALLVEMRQYEYSRLVDIQAASEVPSGRRLFDTLVTYESYPQPKRGPAVAGGVRMRGFTAVEKNSFPVALIAVPGERLTLRLLYDGNRFAATDAGRMVAQLATVLGAVAEGLDRPLDALPLLASGERQQLIVEWNATARGDRRAATLPALFAAQAARTPEAPALVFGGVTVRYRQLAERARGLGAQLRARGVGPEVPVAVLMGRSAELVVAFLAILEAGGYYVPLDPGDPEARLASTLADTAAPLLLTTPASRPLAAALAARLEGRAPSVLDATAAAPAPVAAVRPGAAVDPDNLAYVIYTSGSTGRPKGVAVTHRGVIRLVRDTDYIAFEPADRVAQVSTTNFDAATFEIWGALLNGARLVGIDKELALAPADFAVELRARGITVMYLTAALLSLLAREAPSALAGVHTLVFGGETIDPRWPARVLEAGGPQRLLHVYGPTETTVWNTWERIEAAAAGVPPLSAGRPIANDTLYVLDGRYRPRPLGAVGELCVGGAGVARGYLGRPAITAERFVPDPFAGTPGARLFRTGDLGRLRPDGRLLFVGRRDHQVKIRGHRIELGEVESALVACPAVRQAVVTVREDGPAGTGKRLAAYVVPASTPPPPPAALAADLRAALKETVPPYMVPSDFVTLDALPLTAIGKVDRAALPAPNDAAPASAGVPATGTMTEELVAGIYGEVLGRSAVRADDDFFDLGGHSLLATQVISRLRRTFEVEPPLRLLFEHPAVADLAVEVDALVAAGGVPALPAIIPSAPGEAGAAGGAPLSFAQQRLWFLDRLQPASALYNVVGAMHLDGPLRVAVLARSLSAIVRRHAVLRTVYRQGGRQPRQVVQPAAPLPLQQVDLGALPAGRQRDAALEVARAEARRPFALDRGPMLRATLIRLDRDAHALVLIQHHIASDGWSVGVMINELNALYRAFAAGAPSPLPPLGVQYADFARWQRRWLAGEALDAQLGYWRRQLAALPPRLELPTDRPRPARPRYTGADRPFRLGAAATEALHALGRRHHVTLFMTLLAAYQTVLGRWAGTADLCVGTPIAGRGRLETEPLIGFFVNMLVLRADLGGDPTVAELLTRTRRTALAAHAHQDVPFERLVEALAPERTPGQPPLFQVLLTLQNAPRERLQLADVALRPLAVSGGSAKFDLSLAVVERPDGLRGGLQYSTELFDATTAGRLVGHVEGLLSGLAAASERRLSDLDLLTAGERQQLIAEWSGAAGRAAEPWLLHRLFEAHAARDPEAPALEHGGQNLSYGALDARANRLAHVLRRLGVAPEVPAAVCVERSVELMVAFLAILKAGGVYVPLDPAYPRERLAAMLEAAGAAVLLTRERWLEALPAVRPRTLRFEDLDDRLRAAPSNPPSVATTVDNLAYLIFTSGSTGEPKGVMVPHRALRNFSENQRRTFGLGPGERVLQLTSASFDASISDFILAFGLGGTLCLAEDTATPLGDELLSALGERAISVVTLPPSALATVPAAAGPPALPALRTLTVAGEACSAELVDRWAPGRRFFNLYGPTEASIWSTVARCRPGRRPSIGRSIDGGRVHVVDGAGQPLPAGVAGELLLGGDGIVRGYLGQPGGTAARFVPDPWSSAPGGRLYRSGDRARFRVDGTIDFLGRLDDQVKLRGFRVELGEIEARLRAHPAVAGSAVVAVEAAAGDHRLVAFAVLDEERPSPPSAEALEDFLRASLPAFMVPAAIGLIDRLPLSPNGKTDRTALAGPAREALRRRRSAAPGRPPRTPAEELVAGIFQSLLGAGPVAADDDFFRLGGHSLLATQAVSRLRVAFGVELPLHTFFDRPTVAELAAAVAAAASGGGASATAIEPVPAPEVDGERDRPASFAQQRMWLGHQLDPDGVRYNMWQATRLRGPLEVAALAAAWAQLVRRHETLRTRLVESDHGLRQRVAPAPGRRLAVCDLRALGAERREAALRAVLPAASLRPFNLERGPLVRAALLVLADGDHALWIGLHHAIADGWSMAVLRDELMAAYRAELGAEEAPLPPLPIQYGDYAAWQRGVLAGERLPALLDYWRRQLRGAPFDRGLPGDRPRPALPRFRGGHVSVRLALPLAASLQALGRDRQATTFMVLLAALEVLLHQRTGAVDLVIGTTVAGRDRLETERLIGCFLNQLALRVDLGGDPAFDRLLARVRQVTLDAYRHQALPVERLVETLAIARDPGREPLYQVQLVLDTLPAPAGRWSDGGLRATPIRFESGVAKLDLVIAVRAGDRGLAVTAEYNADRFERATIEALVADYGALLEWVVAAPTTRLSALAERLSRAAADRQQALDRQRGEARGDLFRRARRRPVAPGSAEGAR